MNVTLPDGTVLEGIPEGTTKAQIIEKLQRAGKDVSGLMPATAPVEPAAAPVSNGIGRQLGLSLRAAGNVAASPLVTGGTALNKALKAMGVPVGTDLQGSVDRVMNAAGLPEPAPDRPIEQFAQGMAQTAPAMALPAGIVPQMLGNAAMSSAMARPGEEAIGAGVGAGMGAFGQGLGRAIGGVISPTAAALRLMKKGVPLTPGQMQGGALAKAEEALAQTPLVGAPIRQRMAESRTGWEAATRAEALPPKAGPEAATSISTLQEALSQAYDDSLRGAKFRPGTEPVRQPSTLVAAAKSEVPEATADQANRAIQLVGDLLENSGKPHTPETLQAAESRLKSVVGQYKYSSDPESRIYGRLLDKASGHMRDAWRPALTNTKQSELSAIDSAYSKLVPMERAAGTGKASLAPGEGGEVGSFTPDALLAAIRSGDKGRTKSRWFAGAAPLQKTAMDAAETVGSKTPPPSTVARLAGLAGLVSSTAGLGLVPTLAGLGAAGAYGTKPVQKALTGRFARGDYDSQKVLAEALRKLSPAEVSQLMEE